MTHAHANASSPGMRARVPRRTVVACGSAVAVVVITLYGLHWWTDGRFQVDTDDAYVRADVVTIAPRVAGNVSQVPVADNQHVRAGDVLVRLDDKDYRLKTEQAEGMLAAARARINAQSAGIAHLDALSTQQQSLVAQADATLQARMASAHQASLEWMRQCGLQAQHVTSEQRFEAARADHLKADAELAQARAGLSAARAQWAVLAARREAAVASLDEARGRFRQASAALEMARYDLERTVVRAPIDGQVGQRSVRVGQYADVGTPLMALVPAQTYVVANYKETQTSRIRPNQPVSIAVDAFGGSVLRGRVDSFAPGSGAQFALLPPDNATGNFTKIVQRMPLRIRIEPGQARAADLQPGMSVETVVDTRGTTP
ncbi:HlyD family secretion protein [Dyella sp.]|uniref:HlyD family secretion protein n=1 Tax=Dyella sp. TaxID=1869338 RepID=UPI002ECFFCCB